MSYKRTYRRRRGNVIVTAVFGLVVLVSVTAIVVDLGYVHNARAEIQRSADAAALAACWELAEQYASGQTTETVASQTTSEAAGTANANEICNELPTVPNGDVELGYLADFSAPDQFDTSDPTNFNAVRVTVTRNQQTNGQIRTFFARAMGVNGLNADSTSTAAIVRDVAGIRTPEDGSNVDILPFALDLDTWTDLENGIGSDSYAYDPETKTVSSCGSDGILEVNLYPQGTGSPGNRGTVDIGPANNSTNDIARQILYGISPSDFDAIGGSLEFDANGELNLNGDTGISAGVKDELAAIIGQTRVIPVFGSVAGNGNNANYTIVKLVGVRIMGVKLTGPMKKKHLTV
ncbi:MAG: hypothetical protein KDB27_14290 [Planctomycetales bacterium]|nr:hypothetical protein [Planctomycetales bacterium]